MENWLDHSGLCPHLWEMILISLSCEDPPTVQGTISKTGNTELHEWRKQAEH